jgi:hypothetical protein
LELWGEEQGKETTPQKNNSIENLVANEANGYPTKE